MKEKWMKRAIELAKVIGSWSKDESTKVGAVIFDGNRIVALGFNGPPAGVDLPDNCSREDRLAISLHAEMNCLLHAKVDVTGFTMVCTHHPCAQCGSAIAQQGITTVIIPKQQGEMEERWAESISRAKAVFAKKGIRLVEFG